MSDFELQRENMVESQIRPADVTDRRLLRAIQKTPREIFIPASRRPLAYMDEEIRIKDADDSGPERYLASPMELAKLIQLASIEDGDLVLDVGCGTGYSSAILAQIAAAVVGLEVSEELAAQATKQLSDLGIDNAAFVDGPLPEGCASEGPYDVIVLNGSVPEVSEALLKQLKEGGRLVAVVEDGVVGRACLFVIKNGLVSRTEAFDATLKPLPGFEREAGFVF